MQALPDLIISFAEIKEDALWDFPGGPFGQDQDLKRQSLIAQVRPPSLTFKTLTPVPHPRQLCALCDDTVRTPYPNRTV